MLLLPKDISEKIVDWAKTNVLPEHIGKGGLVENPHITIKYGLSESNLETLQQVRMLMTRQGPISIKLKGLSLFSPNEDGDVLKIDVESKELTELNELITDTFPCESSKYKEYLPHL